MNHRSLLIDDRDGGLRGRLGLACPEAWVNTLSWPSRAVVCRKDGSYILYNYHGGLSWYLFGPDNRLQHDIAGTLGSGTWGYIAGTYDKDAGANNQRLFSMARVSRR